MMKLNLKRALTGFGFETLGERVLTRPQGRTEFRPTSFVNTLPKLVLLGALSFFATFTGCSKELEKDGIPLRVWIKQLSHNESVYRVEAAEAIGSIGKSARSKAEPILTKLAADDPMPKVRVAAILALKSLGAPTNEFEDYLQEVTAPLNGLTPEDLAGTDIIDEMGEIDENVLFKGLQEDDLKFLEELENQVPESLSTPPEVMPADPEEQKAWQDTRRKEQVETVLQQFRNPEVLAELLVTGDPLEKRFAARLLGDKEGVSERVFNSLTIAISDQDTVLKRLATEALKKWTKE